jgi:hypothetical protein
MRAARELAAADLPKDGHLTQASWLPANKLQAESSSAILPARQGGAPLQAPRRRTQRESTYAVRR